MMQGLYWRRRLAVGCLVLGSFFYTGAAHAGLFDIIAALANLGTQKLSAIKVATAQIAVSANEQKKVDIALAEGAMKARAMLSTTVEQLETYRRYSHQSGQSVQVCDAVNQRDDLNSVADARQAYSFASPKRAGRADVSSDGYEEKLLDKRLDAYCSADEHNLGLCQSRFDGMAAASSDYAKIILPDQYTTKQVAAAQDYIANLVPPPLVQIQKGRCESACQIARIQAMRVDALSSMVAVPVAVNLSSRIGVKSFAVKN